MRNVMNSTEGAALRVQLDGMIAVLERFDQMAGLAGDEPVLRLIACLYGAREAASEIEMRPQPPRIEAVPLPAQGVRLSKN
jgi:hypothetical protein